MHPEHVASRAASVFLYNTGCSAARVKGVKHFLSCSKDEWCFYPGNNCTDAISPGRKLVLCLYRNHFLCHRSSDACEARCATCCDGEQQQLSLVKKPEVCCRDYVWHSASTQNSGDLPWVLMSLMKSLKDRSGQDLCFRIDPKGVF